MSFDIGQLSQLLNQLPYPIGKAERSHPLSKGGQVRPTRGLAGYAAFGG